MSPTEHEKSVPLHYGDNRRSWHPAFVAYMDSIVDHPNYAEMPCTRDNDGKIDWTIPSNRSRGSKNWDGNARRREWWRSKAVEIGIPVEGHWLSATAKAIHPFGKKPCQTCGRSMNIAYVYPNRTTLNLISKAAPDGFALSDSIQQSVFDLLDDFKSEFGSAGAIALIGAAFPSMKSSASIEAAKLILQEEYVSKESRRLSPGAMSNAPDRLDGFHTYNLCCRSSQDKGRARTNLVTYGVDRRAFEQWSEGDWAIADLVMAQAGLGRCAQCGVEGPISADHIGPISLGFAHTANFRPLCRSCNSAKNNRMSAQDVADLRNLETDGIKVASWQIVPLWNKLKYQIATDVDAARFSKLLRILQHHYLIALLRAVQLGVPDLLLPLLHPEFAYSRIELVGFNPATLTFESVIHYDRQDVYASSRAARIMRIAFDALLHNGSRPSRNIQIVSDERVKSILEDYENSLKQAVVDNSSALRIELAQAIIVDAPAQVRDESFARIVSLLPDTVSQNESLLSLHLLMTTFAEVLEDRYSRGITVSWDDFEPNF